MSTTARVRITAEDRTAAAFRRVNAAMKNMEMQSRAVSRGLGGIYASLTAIAGVRGLSNLVTTFANFEQTMKGVEAITRANATEIARLEKAALSLGRSTKFSASEAAQGIEILARNGLKTNEILGGALDATVSLAAATGATMQSAADIATDAMLQFGKGAGDLSGVVNGITAVTVNSKFGIDDYAGALAQAGGIASKLGIEFNDLNLILAGTAHLFKSGSDAGTATKTFIQRLVPQSKEARVAMEGLGLEFFDLQGNMKSAADISEELRRSMQGLNDQQKNEKLTQIFGTDGIRVALGLIDQGKMKLQALGREFETVSAASQAAIREDGLGGMFRKFSAAAEGLAIVLGEKLKPAIASVTEPMIELMNNMSSNLTAPNDITLISKAYGDATEKLSSLNAEYDRMQTRLAGNSRLAGILGPRMRRLASRVEEQETVVKSTRQAWLEWNTAQEEAVGSTGNLTTEISGTTEALSEYGAALSTTINEALIVGKNGLPQLAAEAKAASAEIRSSFEDEALTAVQRFERKIEEVNNAVKKHGLSASTASTLVSKYRSEIDKLTTSIDNNGESLTAAQKEMDSFVDSVQSAALSEGLLIDKMVVLDELFSSGAITSKTYNEELGRLEIEAIGAKDSTEELTKSIFDMDEALKTVQGNIQSGFSDLFVDIFEGKGVDSVKDFAKQTMKIFLKLLADMAAAWLTAKIFDQDFSFGDSFNFGGSGSSSSGGMMDIFRKLGSGQGSESAGSSSSTPNTGMINTVKKFLGIGKNASSAITIGSSATGLGASAGAVGGSAGVGITSGYGVAAGGAASAGASAGAGAAASSASGLGAGGFSMAAVAGPLMLAAIAAYGFSKQKKAKQERMATQAEFFSGVNNQSVNEQLNSVTAFRGGIEGLNGEADTLFVTMNEGWTSTRKALEDANLLIEHQSAMYDEAGNELFKITGNIEGIKHALENATVTGVEFGANIEGAISAGVERMRVSVVGDFETIQSAMQSAEMMGIGSFMNLEQTATGASATILGDMSKWNEYLQGFVNLAISEAAGNLDGMASSANNVTSALKRAAEAASSLGSSGGISLSAPDGGHASGLRRVPFDGYRAELHKDERVLTSQETRDYENGGSQSTAILKQILNAVQQSGRDNARAVEQSSNRQLAMSRK